MYLFRFNSGIAHCKTTLNYIHIYITISVPCGQYFYLIYLKFYFREFPCEFSKKALLIFLLRK